VQSRYVLCGEIGAGGMASVHLGRLVGSAAFARTVAIKRLLPRYAAELELRLMLIDEARLAARVRHPNVVQTLEVVANADELLLVMEYVDGASLGRLLRAGAVPEAILAAIVCHVLDGLHAAHVATDEHGAPLQIVHRDISPDNVLVGADGFARVLDFGIAKARSRLHETRDGAIKGKLAYMAPEQLSGKATQQSDVFATAVVLWEGLMGRRLFQADSDGETIGLVLATIVEPPPGALGAIAVRGLARDPAQRWPTARAMAEAIRAAVAVATPAEIAAWVEATVPAWLAERRAVVREIEAQPLEPGAAPPEVAAIGDFIATVADIRQRPQRRRGVVIGGALAVALAAGAFAAVHRASGEPEAARRANDEASPSDRASREPDPVRRASDEPAVQRASEQPATTQRTTEQPAVVQPATEQPAPTTEKPAPVAAPTAPRHAMPSPARKARPHAARKAPACDPPYRLGPLGEKQWLKECL
jgi:serine/threonine-protein kinase